MVQENEIPHPIIHVVMPHIPPMERKPPPNRLQPLLRRPIDGTKTLLPRRFAARRQHPLRARVREHRVHLPSHRIQRRLHARLDGVRGLLVLEPRPMVEQPLELVRGIGPADDQRPLSPKVINRAIHREKLIRITRVHPHLAAEGRAPFIAAHPLRTCLVIAMYAKEGNGILRQMLLQRRCPRIPIIVDPGVPQDNQCICTRRSLATAKRRHLLKFAMLVPGHPDHAPIIAKPPRGRLAPPRKTENGEQRTERTASARQARPGPNFQASKLPNF